MDLTVVVAYTGDPWMTWARKRAIPSAQALNVPVVVGEGSTVAEARNNGLAKVDTEWVVHLDADDELEPGYIDAMANCVADVRVPQVRYIHLGHVARPGFPAVAGHRHLCTGECLPHGNWIVIGAAVRTGMLRDVGGWHEHAWSEDWCTWLRCWQAGATIAPVPDAVYRAHVRTNSRNRGQSAAAKLAAHREIATERGVPVP